MCKHFRHFEKRVLRKPVPLNAHQLVRFFYSQAIAPIYNQTGSKLTYYDYASEYKGFEKDVSPFLEKQFLSSVGLDSLGKHLNVSRTTNSDFPCISEHKVHWDEQLLQSPGEDGHRALLRNITAMSCLINPFFFLQHALQFSPEEIKHSDFSINDIKTVISEEIDLNAIEELRAERYFGVNFDRLMKI